MRPDALLGSLLGLAATGHAAELNVYHRVLSRDAPAGEFTLRGVVSTSSSAGGPTYASTGSPADALTTLARALPASVSDAALYQLALAPAPTSLPFTLPRGLRRLIPPSPLLGDEDDPFRRRTVLNGTPPLPAVLGISLHSVKAPKHTVDFLAKMKAR